MTGKELSPQQRPLLDRITGPEDVKALRPDQLPQLAAEIRSFLVEAVSKTGGHLGPNLGVVELTIAIHRVFNSPRDTIVFDTGHQAYVHKLLTGRHDFSKLRQKGGLSGYPNRGESEHDVLENSHASAGLSWGAGIALARHLAGERDRYTVVVVGDGALTGGLAWEALNNIAAEPDSKIVIVVNDNGRSYAPTIGGLAKHLATLRTTASYEKVLDWGKRTLLAGGKPGKLVYDALHGLKKGIKDVVAPQIMFEDLGIKYLGAVDGHDIGQLTMALRRAKAFGHPVIVHAITEKGRGYAPAEASGADHFHAIGRIHPETGLPIAPSRFGWTSVFAAELVKLARADSRIVALTAAMLEPVGLAPFAAEFPDRVFDVGIAEQHALASAAGMAYAGLHPVVALYASFLNRAYDQLLMDAALHRAPITVVLDRAGLTGQDGPSHDGQWDLALARGIPGLKAAAPRDGATLRAELAQAVATEDGPTLVRYPKGPVPDDIAGLGAVGAGEVIGRFGAAAGRGEAGALRLVSGNADDAETAPGVVIVAVGATALCGLQIGRRLAAAGVAATVIDPRWVLPVDPALVECAGRGRLVVTLEDGLVEGGVGQAIEARLQRVGAAVRTLCFGLPAEFLETATRAEIVEDLGLTPEAIVQRVLTQLACDQPEAAAPGAGAPDLAAEPLA